MTPRYGSALLNLDDYEAAAKERLPRATFDYYLGGANDEVTVRENRRGWEQLALRYRVMVDVSRRALSTTVLDVPLAFPVMIAPMAMQRLAHDDGELATARAAAATGTVMIVSTVATTTLEDVQAATSAPKWFQLYLYQDRGATRALVERAVAAGYRGILVTVDVPQLGRRERDIRNTFSLPPHLRVANAAPLGEDRMDAVEGDSSLARHFHSLHDPAMTPRDLEWIRTVSNLPVIAKGIVRGDDAVRALEHGASAIVVSNHGGRQLDTAVASVRALPEVVEAVAGRAEVLVDGGVRRGTDVVKAIALGARAVLLGRPVLWGLAVGGEAGATRVLSLLRDELDLAMALSGCTSVQQISRDLVVS